ncbi:MAG: hypothetical protein WBF66_07545 [Dehalococcoidia bacterium]
MTGKVPPVKQMDGLVEVLTGVDIVRPHHCNSAGHDVTLLGTEAEMRTLSNRDKCSSQLLQQILFLTQISDVR